jgi:hypothetical protein
MIGKRQCYFLGISLSYRFTNLFHAFSPHAFPGLIAVVTFRVGNAYNPIPVAAQSKV